MNCPNVTNLLYTADRRIDVEWDRGADQGGYTVDLTLAVEDRKGLLAEISAKIADVNTNITNIEAKTQDGHLGRIDDDARDSRPQAPGEGAAGAPQGAGSAGGGAGGSDCELQDWRLATVGSVDVAVRPRR